MSVVFSVLVSASVPVSTAMPGPGQHQYQCQCWPQPQLQESTSHAASYRITPTSASMSGLAYQTASHPANVSASQPSNHPTSEANRVTHTTSNQPIHPASERPHPSTKPASTPVTRPPNHASTDRLGGCEAKHHHPKRRRQDQEGQHVDHGGHLSTAHSAPGGGQARGEPLAPPAGPVSSSARGPGMPRAGRQVEPHNPPLLGGSSSHAGGWPRIGRSLGNAGARPAQVGRPKTKAQARPRPRPRRQRQGWHGAEGRRGSWERGRGGVWQRNAEAPVAEAERPPRLVQTSGPTWHPTSVLIPVRAKSAKVVSDSAEPGWHKCCKMVWPHIELNSSSDDFDSTSMDSSQLRKARPCSTESRSGPKTGGWQGGLGRARPTLLATEVENDT